MVHPEGRTYFFSNLEIPVHQIRRQEPQLEIIEYPIANTEYPISKLRFSGIQFGWKLEIECWILGVQTLKFPYAKIQIPIQSNQNPSQGLLYSCTADISIWKNNSNNAMVLTFYLSFSLEIIFVNLFLHGVALQPYAMLLIAFGE
jgi:hypothetical protein